MRITKRFSLRKIQYVRYKALYCAANFFAFGQPVKKNGKNRIRSYNVAYKIQCVRTYRTKPVSDVATRKRKYIVTSASLHLTNLLYIGALVE